MAFYGKRKSQSSSVRLTGLFKTKKRGLTVGSVDELGEMTGIIKRAIKEEKGLVFFLWRNEDVEEGKPVFTLYMDVSQDQESKSQQRRKAIQQPVEDGDDEEGDDFLDSKVPKGSFKKKDDEDLPF